MPSIGDSSSVGGESSIGSGDSQSNADENVTHTRGVIDDTLRNLTAIRDLVTDANWEGVAGQLDDVDAIVESVRGDLTSIDAPIRSGRVFVSRNGVDVHFESDPAGPPLTDAEKDAAGVSRRSDTVFSDGEPIPTQEV